MQLQNSYENTSCEVATDYMLVRLSQAPGVSVTAIDVDENKIGGGGGN